MDLGGCHHKAPFLVRRKPGHRPLGAGAGLQEVVHTSPDVTYSPSLYGAWHSRVAYQIRCLLGFRDRRETRRVEGEVQRHFSQNTACAQNKTRPVAEAVIFSDKVSEVHFKKPFKLCKESETWDIYDNMVLFDKWKLQQSRCLKISNGISGFSKEMRDRTVARSQTIETGLAAFPKVE
ncbi:MAG: hypothetical protein Q9175_003314 [Cornicularia normoerica]